MFFTLFHFDGLSSEYVIGFGSCLHQDYPQPILEQVKKQSPNLFIMLGDNVYGDTNGNIDNLKNAYQKQKLVLEKFGCPQGLINNAALDSPPGDSDVINGPFEDYPEEAWDKVIDVNLKSIFLTCQIIGKEMADNSGGSIINISSHYGLISPDQRIYNYRKNFYKPISYSASKSGIFNITRYLSTYWGQQSVRVNSLTLGGVFDNQDEEFVNNYSKKVPLGRMAEKHEYNGVIHFLLSDASSYITGSNIVSDGGWTAW